MGKNLLRKIFAFVVLVMGAMTVFSACSKDPYKKMRLALDKTEVTIVYDDDDIEKNVFSISATVSGVGKKVSKDVEFVVGDNSVVSPIGSDYKRTSGDKTTATFVATQNGGSTYIDVLTLEGSKSQRVNVNVVVPIENMAFEMTTLPIERGVKTDITSKFDSASTQIYNRLTFTPQKTTQRDVILTVTDLSGDAFADNEVTIDGNFITVNSETLESFNLMATSKYNSEIVASIKCTVLDTIDVDDFALKQYVSNEKVTLSDINENGQKVYHLNLSAAASNASDEDKQKSIFVDFVDREGNVDDDYVVECVKPDKLPYSISPDDDGNYIVYGGVGNSSDVVKFAIRYKGYENLFAPKYITLRVDVSTFPDEIFFTDGEDKIGSEDSVKVYQNYQSSVRGTAVKLNIFNNQTSLNTQTAYLSVVAKDYGTVSGVKLWYYSGGVKYDITSNTRVKHGETIFMSHNLNESLLKNTIQLVAKSTVCDMTGFVNLNLVKGYVVPSFVNGSVIKMKEGTVNSSTEFVLGLDDVEDAPYLALGSSEVGLDECVVKLQNNSVVTCVYSEDKEGFVFSAGKLPDGVTDMIISGTITAPNGMSADFSVLVYANVNSSNLAMRIGNTNYAFSDVDNPDPKKLTIQTSSWFEIKLIKLLDFTQDENGEEVFDINGEYEVLSSVPNNLVFEKITYDGDAVVSVDFSNKLRISSTRNVGTRKIAYTLYSTSYDPSVSDEKEYMYITFEISVETRLSGFGISGVNDEKIDYFSIITENSIAYDEKTASKKTASLKATAKPDNIELDIKNLAFEVRFENEVEKCDYSEDADGKYEFFKDSNSTTSSSRQIRDFLIKAKVGKNVITMTFTCAEIKNMDSANISITLIYTQEFTDIDGKTVSYADRSTVFDGKITNAIKVKNITFDRKEVTFNVNQFGINTDGSVVNTDRATTSVNYMVTPSSNLTLEGFYLYYKINDNIKQVSPIEEKYNIEDCLNVTINDGYITLNVERYEDSLSEITIYLVPIDMADKNGSIDAQNVKDSSIPAILTVSFRNGTETNPYTIHDEYDLQFVNNQLDAYYILTNDILISSSTVWTPIGQNKEKQFTGNINGNGFKISGLVINQEVNIDNASITDQTKSVDVSGISTSVNGRAVYYGLFGYIGLGASIKDITLENFQVYVEYNGEKLGVTNDNDGKGDSGQNVFVDVYVGGFAGVNYGTLTNVKVVDDTSRGYSSLKGNILNTLRFTSDNIPSYKGIAYQPKNIYKKHSNSVYVGGMVGLNGGTITEGKVQASLFVRDKQNHPTLQGVSTAYVGGVSAVNISTNERQGATVYAGGTIKSVEVYSLINATLVDNIFKGMIRNENSVLGGIVALNISKHGYAKVQNITCKTIIIGQNNIGGAIGQNFGVLDNVTVIPHIYGCDYVGGAVGINAYGLSNYTTNKPSSIDSIDSNYYSGLVYHTKVQFLDTLDEISFFNTSIIGRNYVGGLIGYTFDYGAESNDLQSTTNLKSASEYDFASINNAKYATVAYSSVKSYFTREYTNVNDYTTELKYLTQLYMDFEHKGADDKVDFDKTLYANNKSEYYGDIVVLSPIDKEANTYIGGLIGYSDGGVDTSETKIKGTGGNYIHVYFDAIISNTYNTNNDTNTAIIGGLIGKANGILFVYNANVLGSVKNAKCVGGFVGDASEVFDRLGHEGKTPYSKNNEEFFVASSTTDYSGKFNINNSYTTLKVGDTYVQNFAYLGERVENKVDSGSDATGTVNTITYNKSSSAGSSQNDNYYYTDKKVASVTVKMYNGNGVTNKPSTRSVEKRKVLRYKGKQSVAVQNGYIDKVTVNDDIYVGGKEEDTDYTFANIFKSNGEKTYYTLTESGATSTWAPTSVPEYVKLYYANGTSIPEYKKESDLSGLKKFSELGVDAKSTANKLKASSEDISKYLYDENGIAKYRKTDYYISTSEQAYTYYTENGNISSQQTITVYTCEPAYVEVEANYEKVDLIIYDNGVQNNGSDFYWYNSYIYSASSNSVTINGVSYTIYGKGDSKTQYALVQESSHIEYVVGSTVYSNIYVTPSGQPDRKIIFTYTDSTTKTVDFDDKNMYHLMLDYVVNGASLDDITSGAGQGKVKFSYNRLTASNSFYVGFETYMYDNDGDVLKENGVEKKVTFTESVAKETSLHTQDNTSYSYYPSNWHYTNINYSDLTFEEYGQNSNLVGYYVQYEDQENYDIPKIEEYEQDDVLIAGKGFVTPKDFIKNYNISNYAYALYEGEEDGFAYEESGSKRSTNDMYTYHNEDVNGGLPLAFGKYQNNEDNLNLIIDIAPEGLNATQNANDYVVDNVIKNADGSLDEDTESRPIAVMLDYIKDKENTYSLIGGEDNVVDINLLPKFVGCDNLNVVSSNSAIVEVKENNGKYTLITKGVGSAVINISSLLNNSLSCDIVVLVKESVSSLIYSYSTPSGINTLESGDEISILKNNSSIFSVSAKYNDDVVVLANFGVEYTINSGSVSINGKTYNTHSTAYVYGVSQAFNVNEDYTISAKPFYLYEVVVGDKTYAYRKYVDAITGNSKVTNESITYEVSPNSFAYNISAPGNIQSAVANQTSFEILVQSNDEKLVPFEICFGEKDDKGNDKFYLINTTLENGVYKSLFDNSKDTITVNHLNITLVKTTYAGGRHTIRFVVDVDPNNYNKFSSETTFEIKCKIKGENVADSIDKSDKFTFTLLPFQVENVRMSHYTKFWYDTEPSENTGSAYDYEKSYKSYKYASNNIIPGNNSLLQVDITPSYGKFDYVIAEIVGADGSIIRQLVESQNSQENNQGVRAYYDFPYYEQVNNASNVIKVTNKYSTFDDTEITYDPTLVLGANKEDYFKWSESGTLLFALNLDSKYTNSTVTVRIRGYAQDGDSLQFEQSITLNVVELPRATVVWDMSSNPYVTGKLTHATLNVGGTLDISISSNADEIEWNVPFGKISVHDGKYRFSLEENLSGLNLYNENSSLNEDCPITFTIIKYIDGAEYSTSTTIYVRPVLYLITGVSFLDNGEAISGAMSVYYNEEKDIKVQINAEYNESVLSESLVEEIKSQLDAFAKTVWSSYLSRGNNTYSARYFGKNTTPNNDKVVTLLTTGDYSRSGYVLSYSYDESQNFYFKIRVASSVVKDNIVAQVAFDYTDTGVTISYNQASLSLYGGLVQKELTFNVLASSREENPLPIKSVDDLKNMVAGEHYILLNDLVLSKWVPIEALFATLDGNGYTITITSFGDIEGLTDIGLFSTIGSDDSDLSYYTTIENLYIDICPVTESEDGTLYIDKTATLEVNVGSTEDVHVGVLAGTNYGVITNVNVINNASHIRNSRKESLSVDKDYKALIVEDFSKYFVTGKSYSNALSGDKTINIDSDNMVDTLSVVTSEQKETQGLYVGGLVGLNSTIGYITNSSVENVNVKGMDYVAGFVSQNMGYISSSYFKGGSVISNDKQTKANSATAGFVAKNESGKIQFSYVLGAETQDVYDKNTTENNINSMSTYIDSDRDMLVLNSNSPEYSASDKRTGKIKISLTDYASYAMHKKGTNQDIANLRALGSAVYTNNYASGFVGENNAHISNCYANILVSGTYGAGFAYQNNGEIESSYSMSSIKNNNENYYPFTQSKTDVDKCYYLYVNASDGVTDETIKDSFSKSNDDVATSLYAAAFGDYNTFVSWGFNSDYAENEKLGDGVWFIPKSNSTDGMKKYLRESSYTSLRPELVSANIFTMSLRYYKTEEDGKYSYTNVDTWYDVKGERSERNISLGSLNNPLLIATASDFNTNLSPAKDSKGNNEVNDSIVRMVHDIAFNEIQTATTFTTDFVGNLEGNGLTIDKLRIVADASSAKDEVTYLGLFRSIQKGGTVRNLNINIEEINGSNINFVGVLAGVIDSGKVYNIKISSSDTNVKVEGLNAVGGLAGMIVGEADVVNITNNISIKANAINQLNIFDSSKPNVQNTQFKMFVPNDATKNPFDAKGVKTIYADGKIKGNLIAEAIKNISYVGGIAGIIDVEKNQTDGSYKKLDYTDRIRQCYVNESITLMGDVVGGLAGYVGKDSSLSNSEFVICENTTLNALRVGGAIVGHNEGSLNRVVVKYSNQQQVDSNFYNAENNTQNNSSYYNSLDNARSDSAYTLNIRSDVFGGNAHYIGGIIGANFGGTLNNSYSRLNVVNINSAYAGGLIGLNIGGELDSVYTTGSVKGFFATGGIIGIQPAILKTDDDYYYLDDQSSATNNDYARRYIENIGDVLENLGMDENYNAIQTTYSNVVGANIWRYSDTSVYRSEYYITQGNAWIGVFVGYMTNDTLIKQNSIESRLATENTFFKQTYVYNTNSKSLISEIGNINNPLTISNIEVSETYSNIVFDKNSLAESTIFSLNYTVNEIKYPISRMQYYGSLRSLNEIVSRTYSVTDEVSIWQHMTGDAKYTPALFGRGDVKQLSIYFGFDTFNWSGTLIDSENNTIINDSANVRYIFPEIVNNLKPKIINVTNETELRTMSLYLDSTFILQNDIKLSIVWSPVGTEDKPFTGKLYSATDSFGKQQCFTISNVQLEDSSNDYFGFIRVSAGAELRDFNMECQTINNNIASTQSESNLNTQSESSQSTEVITSIAGGILIGLADEENNFPTTIKNIAVTLAQNTYIYSTRYVGGVVGYGKSLKLSGNVSFEKATFTDEVTSTDNVKFFASMYADNKNNVSFALGGLVGKFDKVDSNNSTTENTLSTRTASNLIENTLFVKNIDFYVNYKENTTSQTELKSSARSFADEDNIIDNHVYIGGVFGYTKTVSEWEINTENVEIKANTLAELNNKTYYSHIGGAIGYSSFVDYTSKITVDTNLTVDVNNNTKKINWRGDRSYTSIGGVFGEITDAHEVSEIANTKNNTIEVSVTSIYYNLYVGGAVGYASSTTFSSAESNTSGAKSNTTSSISTTATSGRGAILAGGFVGQVNSSKINNVEIGSVTSNSILTSKIDLITLKDSNGGTKGIALGGIAGYAMDTNITSSNVLGNINHTFDKDGSTSEYSNGSTYYSIDIGGIVGESNEDKKECKLNQVSADVDIIDNRYTGITFNLGGLVGNSVFDISNSYAVGKIYSVQCVKDPNGTHLGGLVGYTSSNKVFTNCYSATQFVLPNSKDGLMSYSQSFWENTNKGGIIGHTSGECTSTNVFYVKDFVPFSNGLYGTGVSAEDLKDKFMKGLSETDKEYWATSDNFYPLLTYASGKVTNTKGGGQNPIVVTAGTGYTTKTNNGTITNNITSAQTVYVKDDTTGSNYDVVLDDRMSTLVIVGENKLTQNKTIKNNGSIYGGNIKDETIENNGNIIGVLSQNYNGEAEVNFSSVYKVYNSKGFIYASGVFELLDDNISNGIIINSAYVYNSHLDAGNNLHVADYYYSETKPKQLTAQNVENFDLSDTSLDLDIDKYWTRVSGVNGGILVPKWMYKDHYYDDDYNNTYDWYASASEITQNGTTYTVSSAEDLAYIAKLVNTGKLSTNVTIELSADIDLAGKVWTPIGTKDHPFNGVFDGKGHTISNMSVVGNTYNGLFGYTNNATIQNVLIKDAQVASSGKYDYTAILVGYAKGTLTIEKVAIEDAHICAGNNNVAGMVGYLNNCKKLTVNNAYVVIGVNTNRTKFSFVVNTGSGTITINNVYGANIGTDTITTNQGPYNISAISGTSENTYVLYGSSDNGGYKSLGSMRTDTTKLFGKDLWGTTWTRQYDASDSSKTKNHGLPILSFSQEYWIDEGAKTSVTASGNTYTITSASQLAWVAYQVNTGTNNFSGKTVKVTNDIDLAGKVWTPIGITGHPFKGSFELAEGCTISNMTCYGAYSTKTQTSTVSTESESTSNTTTLDSRTYDTTYGGLFGLVEDSPSMNINGSITNFVISKVQYGAPFIAEYNVVSSLTSAPSISVASIGSSGDDSLKDTVSASDYAGGVVGNITGTESVKVNVVGKNVVKANISAEYAGGIVGKADYATIYNSSVSGVSITGTTRTGGIAGEATNSTLFNCKAEIFTLTSTGSDSSDSSGSYAGGIVGYASNTNLSALKVTDMSANIKAMYAGGIVGYVSNSNIQNITFEGKYNNITSDNYGGVAGYMSETNLSEVVLSGSMTTNSGKILVGCLYEYNNYYKDNSKYIVDNINITYNTNISSTETNDSSTVRDNIYKNLFGGLDDNDKDIFSYAMIVVKLNDSNIVAYGDISSSSAWKYDESTGQYTLKTNGNTLYSNYRMENADKLKNILSDVETVDGHVVITPYNLKSVNGGMQYLAEWWTYRHKLSGNDTTINITNSIADYSADSIGNEKFPFVGTLKGNDKTITITLSNNISSQGIIGYATKINVSNITLTGSGYTIGSNETDYVGALVGRIVGNSIMTFENITVNVNVSGNSYVGGIIGAVNWSGNDGSLTLKNCKVGSVTISGSSYVGGIIGAVNKDDSSIQYTCPVTISDEVSSDKVSDVNISATIKSDGDYVGGIVGYARNASINNKNLSGVAVNGINYVGGAVGYAETSTISNVTIDNGSKIEGEYYVGGIVGYAIQTSDNDGKPTPTYCCKVYSNKVQSVNVYGYGSVGGLVGKLYDWTTSRNSTNDDVIIELSGIIYGNTISGSTITLNLKSNEESNEENDYIGGFIGRLEAEKYNTSTNLTKIPSFYMESSEKNNTVSNTSVVYTKNIDMDEGWFGTYKPSGNNQLQGGVDLSSTNRWAEKSIYNGGSISREVVANMAYGNTAKGYNTVDKKLVWTIADKCKGYSRQFNSNNVEGYNTWFGPTDGTNNNLSYDNYGKEVNNYFTTFGTTSSIWIYGNGDESRTLPDLSNDDNIKNFFNTARGYNPNNMPNVGTLYGTNNITDNVSTTDSVTIKSTNANSNENRVLYDRFTHWAYIAMQVGNEWRYGALVIEWSCYIDSDQRMPQLYDFISDVQKDFLSKENQRIDVKYSYDVITGNIFNLNLSNLTPVSESLRSLRDLFGRSTTAGGDSTYKGLINEFVMAVYNGDTNKKSLYCGNKYLIKKSTEYYNGEMTSYSYNDSDSNLKATCKGRGINNTTITVTCYRQVDADDPITWTGTSVSVKK